jgi:hypothetical protein
VGRIHEWASGGRHVD